MKCTFGMGQGKEIINPEKSANSQMGRLLQSFAEFIIKYEIIMIPKYYDKVDHEGGKL